MLIRDFMVGPFALMYHSISDIMDDPFAVSVDAFEEQISWLYEYGFEVVSLANLLRSIQEGNYRALRKKVVITFDDGYKDFVTTALPILLGHGATATVFIVTEMLGGEHRGTSLDHRCRSCPRMKSAIFWHKVSVLAVTRPRT